MRAPWAFPLEVLPPDKKVEATSKNGLWQVNVQTQSETGQRILTAEMRMHTTPQAPVILSQQIKQTWPVGAKWWSSYEKMTNGQLELRAHLMNAP